MQIQRIAPNERMEFNISVKNVEIGEIGDKVVITSLGKITLKVLGSIGKGVLILPAKDSCLIIEDGVKIGPELIVRIEGNKAQITCNAAIPKDAKLIIRPR